jgi:hypothetical protein
MQRHPRVSSFIKARKVHAMAESHCRHYKMSDIATSIIQTSDCLLSSREKEQAVHVETGLSRGP